MGICGTRVSKDPLDQVTKFKGGSFSDTDSSLSSLGENDIEDIDDVVVDHSISGLIDREVEEAKRLSIEINGKSYRVDPGITLYEASGIVLGEQEKIPTLCYHPYLPCARLYKGKCGICEVEDENGRLIRACRTTVYEGMKVVTNSERVERNITTILKKKLSNHILRCPVCPVQGNCYFEKLLQKYDVSTRCLDESQRKRYFQNQTDLLIKDPKEHIIQNEALVYDHSKCLTCYRCVRVCQYIQGMSKSSLVETDGQALTNVRTFKDLEDYHKNMFSTDCIRCGMCSFVCPVGAITENSKIPEIQRLFREKFRSGKTIVCQVAPSVTITISELFGCPPGTVTEGQVVTGLKDLGFDYVFDTAYGADLCVMEESRELMDRMQKGGTFPMFTSCCPAWVNLVEKHFPNYIRHLSTCKSPQAMMASIIKTYWAEQMGKSRDDIVLISVMPCVGKKSENTREGMEGDVDFTITTRELGRFLKKTRIELPLKDETPFDSPMGSSSSAGVLFGASGGVMEAALRTTYELLTGNPFPAPTYGAVRGLRGLKMSLTKINETRLRIAVCSGGANIRKFIQKLRYESDQSMSGISSQPYIVEVMACPGGCIGGGGNPKFDKLETLRKRLAALYTYDSPDSELNDKREYRKSHENPDVKKLYENFLKSPGSDVAKRLLHTTFKNRKTVDMFSKEEESEESDSDF